LYFVQGNLSGHAPLILRSTELGKWIWWTVWKISSNESF